MALFVFVFVFFLDRMNEVLQFFKQQRSWSVFTFCAVFISSEVLQHRCWLVLSVLELYVLNSCSWMVEITKILSAKIPDS